MSPKLILGTLLALGGAIVGAVLWAAITASIHWQIGYMAVGVGLLAGYGMRVAAGDGRRIEAIVAGIVALFGCVLGNLLTGIVVVAQHEHVPIPPILGLMMMKPALAVGLITDGFQPMDLLFYGIAVYAGYRAAVPARRPAPPPGPEMASQPPAGT